MATTASRDRGPRVLLVDDDQELCALMTEFLAVHGYEVETAVDSSVGLDAAVVAPPDLIILDVMMPRLDGFDLLRRLRRQSRVPVLMLSARAAPEDRIHGLNVGADDYLIKPFVVGELLARIKAILRRARAGTQDIVTVGALRLDPRTRDAWNGERAIALTAMEFDLLQLLSESAGTIVSRDSIARTLYGRETTAYERVIDVHISHLRKKLSALEDIQIKTVRGLGYVLVRNA